LLRRRILAFIILIIVVSSILGVWTFRERLWKKPEIERAIVVLADSEDYSLASGLIDFFKAMNLEVIHVKASDFSSYKNYRLIIIVGGPYSQEGVWNLLREILRIDEQEHISKLDHRATYLKEDFWSKEQQIVIFVGSDRNQAKKAWSQTIAPPHEAEASKVASKAMAVPLHGHNSSSKVSSFDKFTLSMEKLFPSPQDEEHEIKCDPLSAIPRGKIGTGEVDDANGNSLMFDRFDELQDYVNIKVPNPMSLVQNYQELCADPTGWFIGHLQEWAQDQITNIYRIEITCECGSTMYTINLEELGDCFSGIQDFQEKLNRYLDIIRSLTCPTCHGQFTINWRPISDSMLDNLRTELLGTGDLEEFLENFAGIDEEFEEFPWGLLPKLLTWIVPCASAGITPCPVVIPLAKPVGFFLDHDHVQDFPPARLGYWVAKEFSEGELTSHASSWLFRCSWDRWSYRPISYGYCVSADMIPVAPGWMRDHFYYNVIHSLFAFESPKAPGVWGCTIRVNGATQSTYTEWLHNQTLFLQVPLTVIDRLGVVYEFQSWTLDGSEFSDNTVIAIKMGRPHEIVARFQDVRTQTVPAVLDSGPAGLRLYPVTVSVWFEFNKSMDHASTEAAFSLYPTLNPSAHVAGTFSWPTDWFMIFTPNINLAFNTYYQFRLDPTATDQDGIQIVPNLPVTGDFRTQDGPRFTLRTALPILPGAQPIASVGGGITIIATAKHYDNTPAARVNVTFSQLGVIGDFERYPSTARTDDVYGEALITWIAGSIPGTATFTASAEIDGIPVQASIDIPVVYGAWPSLWNPDFEDWLGVVMPYYWARDSTAGFIHQSTDRHSGRYSIEIGEGCVISQIFEVSPSTKYVFGWWAKVRQTGIVVQRVVELQWLDSSYNPVVSMPYDITDGDLWKDYSYVVTSESNAIYAKVVFYCVGVDSILIDDVRFERWIPPPALLSIDVWTNKGGQGLNMPDGSYHIGETVVIYFSINVNATVRLTVIKPDGTRLTYGPESLTADVYTITAEAGYPLGQRVVILEAWVGDQHATDTVTFTVLEGE